MIEIRSIVCPIDFSDFSRLALDHAVAIARRYESTITAVHVCPMIAGLTYASGIAPISPVVLTDADREQLELELRTFVNAELAPGITIDTSIREGDAVTEILEEAKSRKANLLTVGTHGRSGFERFLLGSVTEKLLRKASCPVLTVPRRHPDAVPASPVVFKRIMCPIDFSECSMSALNYAMSLAQEVDGQLTVLYVIASDLLHLPGEPDRKALETISVAEYFIMREENVRRRLNEAVPAAAANYCKVETVIRHGKPAAEIRRLASERDSDIIVIGVRGRGAADLAVFGSTTQQVVREAVCPVLTIRGS